LKLSYLRNADGFHSPVSNPSSISAIVQTKLLPCKTCAFHAKEPKGLDITPWDGDPATLRPFITDVLVEFSMKPRTYHNEDVRIKSIYGWLKTGSTPKLWARDVSGDTIRQLIGGSTVGDLEVFPKTKSAPPGQF
jgi:hypothetical protein